MYYLNACELLNTCIKAGVLNGEENGYIFVYRGSGEPKEKYPEGWYKEPFDVIAKEVAGDTNARELLERELSKRGITPRYTDIEKMRSDIDAFLSLFQGTTGTGN